MDKDVIYTCNGILLSHKKEWNSAICKDMDEPRDCHKEWSKSERKKQISYNITFMWSLEKMVEINLLAKRN